MEIKNGLDLIRDDNFKESRDLEEVKKESVEGVGCC